MQGNSITDFVYTYETQYAHQFNHIVREKKKIIWLYSTLTGGFTHIHQQRHLFHYSQTTRVLPFSIFIFSAVQALRVVFFFFLLLPPSFECAQPPSLARSKKTQTGPSGSDELQFASGCCGWPAGFIPPSVLLCKNKARQPLVWFFSPSKWSSCLLTCRQLLGRRG